MSFIFNPIRPKCPEDENDNDYLNAVDEYIDEMWLLEHFGNLEDEENAST